MRIVVTGADGALGHELCALIEEEYPEWESFGLTRNTADLATPSRTTETIRELAPSVVAHCAALTNVDGCESEREKALEVNVEGTRCIAEGAAEAGARLVYISSDYVFDGNKGAPYLETDFPNPVNFYGKTKLMGEEIALAHAGSVVVRTSWLYGERGKNFVKTILSLAEKGSPLRVVDDQRGSPTNIRDLAEALLLLIRYDASGVYHFSNSGETSWCGFAREIVRLRKMKVDVEAIPTSAYPRPAQRPAYSKLDTTRYSNLVGRSPRSWESALKEYLLG